MKKLLVVAVLLAFQSVGLSQGTVQVPTGKDNTIYSESLNSNGQGKTYAGRTCNGNLRRGLLYFDISSMIPAGSIISSVSLELNVDNVSNGIAAPTDYSLHRMSTDWGEGTSNGGGSGAPAVAPDATWADAMLGTATWTTLGGDFLAASATTTLPTTTGTFSWTGSGLTADVQLWLDNPGANFGWGLTGDELTDCTARRFGSDELGTGPALTVNYTCPIPPTASCQNLTVYLDGSGQFTIDDDDIDNGSFGICSNIIGYSTDITTFGCADITDASATPSLMISAAYDGPLSGGTPKGVELYVINDIADLSVYGISSANNGGGTTGTPEFTFPADAVSAGTYIYVTANATEFSSFFGFAANYTSGSMGINGDDAIELFFNSNVIDVFGDVDTDGTGQTWDHLDGWAYRNSLDTPNGGAFDDANWTYSGPNAWDGETDNATATSPMPIGTFTTPASLGVLVELTVSDDMSNIAACTSIITVLDTLPPSVTCVGATTMNLDATGNLTITTGDLESGTSTDNCTAVTLTLSQEDFTCADEGVNTVYLIATDQYGNADSCSVDVTILPMNTVSIDGITSNITSCFEICDGDLTIAATNAVSYSIDNGVTFQAGNVFTGLCADTYDVVVMSDVANCSLTATTTAPVDEPAEITTSFVVTDVNCFGANNGAIDMTTSAGMATSTIDWDNDMTGDNDDPQDISGLSPAMYHVTIIDGSGCIKLDSAEVMEGSVIDLTTTVTGFDIMSNESGATSYQWLNCGDGSQVSGATSQTYTAIANGDYEVEITSGTCVDTSECQTISGVGIDETNGVEFVEIYPNPSNGNININLGNNTTVVSITVIDINGKTIATHSTSDNNLSLNLSEVENGIYFVQINTANDVITKKISIRK